MIRPAQIQQTGQQQEPMAYGQAITQGPGGQMYTDTSMQTPYNPSKNMNTQTRNTDFGPVTITSPGFSSNRRLNLNMGRGFPGGPPLSPDQDMRARPPQRGIGSFQNPFGGFMGGGRGNFMRPQPPMYGGGFGGGYGMQPPMFGGGMGYGRPPMFGGGMYGGGFGMQPPMFGGGYGGGFGSPFGQSFYGGIGGMFPGMGGGYGMRPPSYGGFGGGFNRPMPQPIRPQPALPIKRPMPFDPRRGMPIMRTQGPDNIGGGRPSLQRVETKGPESLMRQDRIANYSTDRNIRNMQLQPF